MATPRLVGAPRPRSRMARMLHRRQHRRSGVMAKAFPADELARRIFLLVMCGLAAEIAAMVLLITL